MEGVINCWWLHALALAGTTLLICLLVEDSGNPAELQKGGLESESYNFILHLLQV